MPSDRSVPTTTIDAESSSGSTRPVRSASRRASRAASSNTRRTVGRHACCQARSHSATPATAQVPPTHTAKTSACRTRHACSPHTVHPHVNAINSHGGSPGHCNPMPAPISRPMTGHTSVTRTLCDTAGEMPNRCAARVRHSSGAMTATYPRARASHFDHAHRRICASVHAGLQHRLRGQTSRTQPRQRRRPRRNRVAGAMTKSVTSCRRHTHARKRKRARPARCRARSEWLSIRRVPFMRERGACQFAPA